MSNFANVKIVRSRWLPPKDFLAINLLGVIVIRPGTMLSARTINHERIHTAQMRELGYVLFYLLYVLEWVVRLFMRGNAYYNLTFEREAYRHEAELDYLKHRRHFEQWRRTKGKR